MDLSYMSHLDETAFEAERCRLINAEIKKAPPDRQRKLLAFQMQLDLVRDKVSSEEFMLHCANLIGESTQNLADQLTRLRSALVAPPVRPPAER